MVLPKDLNLYMTSKCNFNCKHCSRSSNKPQAADVTVKLVKSILKLFPINTVCVAGFGEPLMNPNTIDVMKYLTDKGLVVSLITNGSKLLEYADELMEMNLLHISVSLNVADSEGHVKLNGTKTFGKIIEGINYIKENCNHIPIGISKVCTTENLEEIPNFMQLGSYLGASFIHLINCLPYVKDEYSKTITENDRELINLLEYYRTLPSAIRVKHWPIPIRDKCPETCNSPWKSIGIDGDGYISGCRRIFGPSKVFGHFTDIDVWERGKELTNLRMAIRGKGKYAWACKHCFGNYKQKKEKR